VVSASDVAIVGTGPNGLAAGVVLARAGLRVELHEGAGTIGGGLRSAPLFDTGVVHDLCSAVHPMAAASPSSGRSTWSPAGSNCCIPRSATPIRWTGDARPWPTAHWRRPASTSDPTVPAGGS
jgi:phytoene dehydrogenase-like protein